MSEENVVGIPQGKLRGKKERSATGDEFYTFHKIPYAKAPVGELRFKAPQPGDKWEGVRDATQEGPICPSTDFQDRKKYQDICNEDGLFLNVYCKHNPNTTGGKKYPVMVWIHGGGFEFGSGNKMMVGPDYFMQYDVVVVTFNYRLGALGRRFRRGDPKHYVCADGGTGHEGAFITKHPWMLLKEGKQLDVPLITGLCTQEMIFGISKSQKVPELNTIADFQRLLPKNIQFKDSDKAAAVAKRIKEFYFKDGVNLDSYLNVLSDIYFNYGAYKAIKARKNCSSPTYLYLFTYQGEQSGFKEMLGLCDGKGTCHGEDMLYFFKTMFSNMDKMKPGSRDYKFMVGFTKMWMSFVTTGVPSPEGAKWTRTTPEGIEYLDIGEKYQMKSGLMRERFLLWDEIYTSCYDH